MVSFLGAGKHQRTPALPPSYTDTKYVLDGKIFMVYNNILEAVGHTPVVRLNHMVPEGSAEVLVKFEGLNVGGSIKTRTALNMLEDAEKKQLISPGRTVIVEPTSGNQGIGLALCGAVKGYKVKIIMPDSVSEERRMLVKHYGAEVILVHDAGNIGDCIDECQRMADDMAANDPDVFVPGQFDNPANPEVHRKYTAQELLEQVDGPIHGFCFRRAENAGEALWG